MNRIRTALQKMCRALPGGWATMAAALGMSVDGLENRIYERKGQEPSIDLAMQMQKASGLTAFAEAVAAESGGVFVPVDGDDAANSEDLMALYMKLAADVGRLAQEWQAATADGEICKREAAELDNIRQEICRTATRFNALSLRLFRREQ